MKSLLRSLILVVGPCGLFERTRRAPGDGALPPATPAPQWENKRILGRTDPAICGFALEQDHSSKYETPRWEDDSTFRKYVDEAKRRGFSAHSCAALFEWKSAQT